MNTTVSFGQWLRTARKANELTQEELARQVGCAATTLRLIEANKRRPSKQLAQRLAMVLDVPEEDRVAFLQHARKKLVQHAVTVRPLQAQAQHSKNDIDPIQFIEFDKNLDECTALLNEQACRLLTILGPTHIGKTQLASVLATRVAHRFRDGVVFVPLAQINDVAMLTTVILVGLGIRERDQYDAEGWLLDYLRGKEVLLILDNFEHLVTGGTFLAQMLQQAPLLKIVVTSRERLALQAEWLYDLSVI